jgi:hypothetical protein
LAYVAAKLALGSDLVTLRNSVTLSTTACFEPSLDYCVAKVPRWDLRKFSTVDPAVGSCMKSVGEVMAIGRTFEETIQKALRMVDESCSGFDAGRFDLELGHRGISGEEHVRAELEKPSPTRIWAIAKAFQLGMSIGDVQRLTSIDHWFLAKLFHIHKIKQALGCLDYHSLGQNEAVLREAKRCGFADRQIASELLESQPTPKRTPIDGKLNRYMGGPVKEAHVRDLRKQTGVNPVVKQIDTLAAEFPAETNYLYLTYSGEEHDVHPSKNSSPRVSSKEATRLSTPSPLNIPEPLTLSGSRAYNRRLNRGPQRTRNLSPQNQEARM